MNTTTHRTLVVAGNGDHIHALTHNGTFDAATLAARRVCNGSVPGERIEVTLHTKRKRHRGRGRQVTVALRAEALRWSLQFLARRVCATDKLHSMDPAHETDSVTLCRHDNGALFVMLSERRRYATGSRVGAHYVRTVAHTMPDGALDMLTAASARRAGE